jgi:hypothetical protein
MRAWLIMAAPLLPCRAPVVSSRMTHWLNTDQESLITIPFSAPESAEAPVLGEAVGRGGSSVLDSVLLLASESE